MKRIQILTIITLFGLNANSNSYLYTRNFYDNIFLINPAYSGLKSNHVNIFGQKQWIGIENSPECISLNANGRIGKFNFYDPTMMLNKSDFKSKAKIGFGVNFFTEIQGTFNIWGSNLTYGYHIQKQNQVFSMGLLVNYTSISFYSANQTVFYPNDPLLSEPILKDNYFNTGIGLAYSSKKFNAGISYLHFLPNFLDNNLGLNFYYNNISTLNLNFEYIHKFENFLLKPKILLSANKESVRYYVGLDIDYKSKLIISLNYKYYQSLGFEICHSFSKFYLKYSYDFPIGNNSVRSFGSCGISIGKLISF